MKPTSTPASDRKPLIVTAGEPAGIGPEICLALAGTAWSSRIVVVADRKMLAERAELIGMQGREDDLQVIDEPLANPVVCGKPDPANAASLLKGLERAVEGCKSGEFGGLVTGPLQKSVINEAGIAFTGHTEYLAELTGTATPVMLLAAGDLRVALASTHLALRDVPDYLTKERLVAVFEVLHHDLRDKFSIANPRILVCGLNPHAGEGGHLGTEDSEIIAPAIAHCVANGMDLRGPVPADTAFTPAAGESDAVVAMYHDQGLPVVKHAGFGHAVNVTLGLPIIRTSVDHGTALDLAGTGKADSGSMIAAVELAAGLAAR